MVATTLAREDFQLIAGLLAYLGNALERIARFILDVPQGRDRS
jgi:hypothetical protein